MKKITFCLFFPLGIKLHPTMCRTIRITYYTIRTIGLYSDWTGVGSPESNEPADSEGTNWFNGIEFFFYKKKHKKNSIKTTLFWSVYSYKLATPNPPSSTPSCQLVVLPGHRHAALHDTQAAPVSSPTPKKLLPLMLEFLPSAARHLENSSRWCWRTPGLLPYPTSPVVKTLSKTQIL